MDINVSEEHTPSSWLTLKKKEVCSSPETVVSACEITYGHIVLPTLLSNLLIPHSSRNSSLFSTLFPSKCFGRKKGGSKLLRNVGNLCHCIMVLSLTNSWSWALLEKLPIVQLLENFPAFNGTRRFITAVTYALHRCLSWARSLPSYLSKIHYNIVHPSTSWSSQWSLPFWLSHQYPICIAIPRQFWNLSCSTSRANAWMKMSREL
jgi:hypothetical protein